MVGASLRGGNELDRHERGGEASPLHRQGRARHSPAVLDDVQVHAVVRVGRSGEGSAGLEASRVHLFFGQGAQLAKTDPEKLLQGHGKTVRHIALKKAADLDRAEVQAFVAAALKLAKLRLDANAKGSIVIKAEAQKQRARRAKKARARPASSATPRSARALRRRSRPTV